MAGKGAKKRARREKKKEDKGWQKRGKRKVCIFCVDRIAHVDYKDASTLRKFISERGKIRARRRLGARAEASSCTARSTRSPGSWPAFISSRARARAARAASTASGGGSPANRSCRATDLWSCRLLS